MPAKSGLSATNVSLTASEGMEKAGTIKAWGNATIPTGWLELLGQTVLRADYPGLFAIFGTTFNTGGELGTEFRLPDGQGRSLIGVGTYTDTVSGSVSRTLGQKLGAEKHVMTTAEMPAHNHGVNDPGHSHGYNVFNAAEAGGYGQARAGSNPTEAANNTNSQSTGISTQNNGSGNSHNNMQPSLAMKLIVKT